jgi:ribonuclease BN (tRNA processing enzyme)
MGNPISRRRSATGRAVIRLIAIVALLLQCAAKAQEAGPASGFITLGTSGGPIANAGRSQPANALLIGPDIYLVDVGDGAAGQLAKAGLLLLKVRGVFLSHLHFDHTGGLMAVLGLRTQLDAADVLVVYGPPGTRQLVDGLLEGMQPAFVAAFGIPGQTWTPRIEVRELTDGTSVTIGDMAAARNSHYSFPDDSPEFDLHQSLSLRFDLPDRSIVYTGDTGPSRKVEALAAGADLLVSEIIDVDGVIATIRRTRPDLDPTEMENAARHLSDHHLRPCEVGELASRAGVADVVITHFVPVPRDADGLAEFQQGVEKCFDGKVRLANDLDRF